MQRQVSGAEEGFNDASQHKIDNVTVNLLST
jgi:hypothetical protein